MGVAWSSGAGRDESPDGPHPTIVLQTILSKRTARVVTLFSDADTSEGYCKCLHPCVGDPSRPFSAGGREKKVPKANRLYAPRAYGLA